ncbi:ABC transporter ATP-binding protein [Microbacterium sp. G2-8]|uniref:ABC transporter ATP-binding protein n=1 Tax=Microbacterium sp. G2-8 TaxID=2842454 RepID=UPI001C8970BC|nr:ABC transporter ATP-binding protein [Microbacterium sp. G2-8]
MSISPPAPPAHDGISVRGVARSFGVVHAVRDVTFEAPPGRITGLVGPNGAGKTTLFLMLASLLAPDAGEIRVGGANPVDDPSAARERLGWMPDALGAWESLTARETLVVAGRLYGRSKAEAGERAEHLIAEVGLAELATAPARVLSRGQKQLLGLARALVHEPRVLLLDEPASGLDPSARIALRHHLRRIADDGAAILVSSHVLAELEEMVDDAVFMSQGATVAGTSGDGAARQREWRIRVAGAPDPWAVRDAVAGALEGRDVRVERRDLVAAFADDADAARALQALVAAGVPVAAFAPASGDLERAFLDMKEGTE